MKTLTLTRRRPDPEQREADDFDGARYTWPSPVKPSALMIPRGIRSKRAEATTTRYVTYGVATVIALALALAVTGTFEKRGAQTDLDVATADLGAAQSQVDLLAPIATYYDGLDQRRTAAAAALSNDVDHEQLLGDIIDALPSAADLTGYTTTLGAPCASPDPFTVSPEVALGCITFSGTASNEAAVAQVVSALTARATKGVLVDPFVSSIDAASASTETSYSVSVNFTAKALSTRFTQAPESRAPNAASGASASSSTATQEEGQ